MNPGRTTDSIVYETPSAFVTANVNGLYRVYRVGACASERAGTYHFPSQPNEGLRRAKERADAITAESTKAKQPRGK